MPDETEEESGPKLKVMEGRKSAKPDPDEPAFPLAARRIRLLAIPCYWCADPNTYTNVPVYMQPQTVADNAPIAANWVRNWQVKIQGHCWTCGTSWVQDLVVSVKPGDDIDQLCRPLTPTEYNQMIRGCQGPADVPPPDM